MCVGVGVGGVGVSVGVVVRCTCTVGRIRFEHTEVFLLTNFDSNTNICYVVDSTTAKLAN